MTVVERTDEKGFGGFLRELETDEKEASYLDDRHPGISTIRAVKAGRRTNGRVFSVRNSDNEQSVLTDMDRVKEIYHLSRMLSNQEDGWRNVGGLTIEDYEEDKLEAIASSLQDLLQD